MLISILLPHSLLGIFNILKFSIGIFSFEINLLNRNLITSGKTISPPELKAVSYTHLRAHET